MFFAPVGQVLDVAYLVVGGLCTFIGAAGYYMYGNAALDVITFNLPKVTKWFYGPTNACCVSVVAWQPQVMLERSRFCRECLTW